jgi:hypothetical protein
VSVTLVFLKKSLIAGTFLSAILMAPGVGEEEVSGATLSASESLLASLSACRLTGGRSWAVSLEIECKAGMEQRAVEKDSRRLEGKSEKRWDETCSTTPNFVCALGDSVMIRFTRKKMSFCFSHPRYLDAGLKSQKV